MKVSISLILGLLFLVIGASACSSNHDDQETDKGPENSRTATETDKVSEAPVVVAEVRPVAGNGAISYTQVSRGIHEARLDSKRPGRIMHVDVVLGQSVREGETLIRLDNDLETYQKTAAEASLAAARAALEKAVLDWERARQLRLENAISESSLERTRLAHENALAGLRSAQAALSVARKNLAETNIVAPISGEVSQLPFEVGETPPPGATVAEVTDRSKLILDLFLAERDLKTISVGDSASVTSSSLPGERFTGRVRALNPKGDERTKLFRAEVVVANPKALLRSGMTLTASFFPREASQKLVIPGESVVMWRGKPHVVSLNDSHARYLPVTLGPRVGSGVTALSGLSIGDIIVVEGAHAIAEGAALNVIGEIPLDSLLH